MTGPVVVKELEATVKAGLRWSAETRVVSVKAFETLDGPRGAGAVAHVRALIDDARDSQGQELPAPDHTAARQQLYDLPVEGGRVSLPDGREIVVEQTTYEALWEATGRSWLSFRVASTDAVLRLHNLWAAERYAAQEGRA